MVQQFKDLASHSCGAGHNYSIGSSPSLGTSTDHRCSWKKEKKGKHGSAQSNTGDRGLQPEADAWQDAPAGPYDATEQIRKRYPSVWLQPTAGHTEQPSLYNNWGEKQV